MSLFAEWYSDVVRTPERDAAHQLRGEERWGEVGRDRERDRETERDTERDRERQRETERDRERQRETERQRQRQGSHGRTFTSLVAITWVAESLWKMWRIANKRSFQPPLSFLGQDLSETTFCDDVKSYVFLCV